MTDVQLNPLAGDSRLMMGRPWPLDSSWIWRVLTSGAPAALHWQAHPMLLLPHTASTAWRGLLIPVLATLLVKICTGQAWKGGQDWPSGAPANPPPSCCHPILSSPSLLCHLANESQWSCCCRVWVAETFPLEHQQHVPPPAFATELSDTCRNDRLEEGRDQGD